jgi:hypothetical protein
MDPEGACSSCIRASLLVSTRDLSISPHAETATTPIGHGERNIRLVRTRLTGSDERVDAPSDTGLFRRRDLVIEQAVAHTTVVRLDDDAANACCSQVRDALPNRNIDALTSTGPR